MHIKVAKYEKQFSFPSLLQETTKELFTDLFVDDFVKMG